MKYYFLFCFSLTIIINIFIPKQSIGIEKIYLENEIFSNKYKLLCIEDQKIGFNWRNEEYVFTKFQGDKYIVQKFNL